MIIDRDTARTWNYFQDADDLWTPAMADVQALEEKLPSYLTEEWARRKAREKAWRAAEGFPPDTRPDPHWDRALSYHRQYVGIVTSHRRIIFGNFFCDDPPIDWRRQMVFAFGGGACLFHFSYDVEEGRLFDLFINTAA